MKALSLTAPWAHLLFVPKLFLRKTMETRSWQTSYRGTIAIHASKSFPAWARRLALEEDVFLDALTEDHWTAVWDCFFLPLGCILGTVDLVAIHRTEAIRDSLSATELAFGDYSNGRKAWQFANPVLFPEPIPAKGALSLWNWDEDVTVER